MSVIFDKDVEAHDLNETAYAEVRVDISVNGEWKRWLLAHGFLPKAKAIAGLQHKMKEFLEDYFKTQEDVTMNIPQIIPDPADYQAKIARLELKLARMKRKRDTWRKRCKSLLDDAIYECISCGELHTSLDASKQHDMECAKNPLRARAEAAEARIARLIEAGDGLLESMAHGGYRIAIAAWQQAKEDAPA